MKIYPRTKCADFIRLLYPCIFHTFKGVLIFFIIYTHQQIKFNYNLNEMIRILKQFKNIKEIKKINPITPVNNTN